MKIFLLAFFCMFSAFPLRGNTDVSAAKEISEHFRSEKIVAGKFFQTKKLSDLDIVLKSAGTFVFSRERGVIWETQNPIKSAIVIRAGTISFFDKNNVRTQKIELGENQTASEIFKIIRDTMLGDFSGLKKMFSESASVEGSRRILCLNARKENRAILPFEKIRIEENAGFIEKITFESPRDNETTEIRFAEIRRGNADDENAFGKFPQ